MNNEAYSEFFKDPGFIGGMAVDAMPSQIFCITSLKEKIECKQINKYLLTSNKYCIYIYLYEIYEALHT